ncbi:MAG: GreA/GreB family elongation factor [Patescibacteria group bacterium]
MKQIPPLPPRILFTKKGYDDVLEEKKKLLTQRPDAVENLRKSREMGDLSENGYYKASRARLSSIDARLRKLEKMVRLGKIIENVNTNGVIGFGSRVTVSDTKGTRKFTIVGGYESDPSKHTVSHFSPLGKALIGKRKGDPVILQAPRGQIEMLIDAVE